jgi:four helix bundle protein
MLAVSWMGARDFRELVVWQLADQLQNETLRLIGLPGWETDFKLRDEADKTASQIKRSISEGFRRPTHPDFARFLEYSFSSVGELRALFDDAYKKQYATACQLQAARDLCFRLERGLRAFVRYLKRNDPPPWWNK